MSTEFGDSAGLPRFIALAILFTMCANVRAADEDALALEAPAADIAPTRSEVSAANLRLFGELAAGRLTRRGGLGNVDSRRVSIDYTQSFRPLPGWRAVLSNRLDDIHPADSGERATTNSLRESYLSWQDGAGEMVLEFGRINLRNGPAYGNNPTDYFRGGALRAISTADPLALREIRLGTVMLRAQKLWTGGGLSLALAPKLADHASDAPFSLDLGATNSRKRGLLTWSGKSGKRLSWQMLGYAEEGRGPQLGANGTYLMTDAIVAHGEFSRGPESDRLASLLDGSPSSSSPKRARWTAGLTYTAPTRTAITVEYAHDGAAPNRESWAAAAQGTDVLGTYLLDAQKRQDNASRGAWLVYVSQKSLAVKNLDLNGFVRVNADDHSRFAWLEVRYHLDRIDVAAQWFGASGSASAEYGLIPNRRSLQLILATFF
ncbi:hypothetical protein [Aquabacterium sp. OR-4]|uniref:hypothetical protein n=1 Tax=Aquabacterium sp. OR-4 TaxID=2978127 RepID=UPI0028C5B08E|nr:hypothetical protein [Aquabacterium sp. OR-4]MDT7837686.1 hypothetical protein [Aquabacterium sp. OR-4]